MSQMTGILWLTNSRLCCSGVTEPGPIGITSQPHGPHSYRVVPAVRVRAARTILSRDLAG
jgi:hypothetical protein